MNVTVFNKIYYMNIMVPLKTITHHLTGLLQAKQIFLACTYYLPPFVTNLKLALLYKWTVSTLSGQVGSTTQSTTYPCILKD